MPFVISNQQECGKPHVLAGLELSLDAGELARLTPHGLESEGPRTLDLHYGPPTPVLDEHVGEVHAGHASVAPGNADVTVCDSNSNVNGADTVGYKPAYRVGLVPANGEATSARAYRSREKSSPLLLFERASVLHVILDSTSLDVSATSLLCEDGTANRLDGQGVLRLYRPNSPLSELLRLAPVVDAIAATHRSQEFRTYRRCVLLGSRRSVASGISSHSLLVYLSVGPGTLAGAVSLTSRGHALEHDVRTSAHDALWAKQQAVENRDVSGGLTTPRVFDATRVIFAEL